MKVKNICTGKQCNIAAWHQLKPGYGEKLQAALFMLGGGKKHQAHTPPEWDVLTAIVVDQSGDFVDVLSYNVGEQWEVRPDRIEALLAHRKLSLEGLLNEH